MKPKTKLIVIIATICMAAGLALSATAFAIAGFDPRNLSTTSPSEEKSYLAKTTDFHEVRFEGLSEDVVIKPTTDEQFSVDYFENDQTSFEITEEGNVFHVVEMHQPKFSVFNFNLEFDRRVTINVPESYTGSISLTSASGIFNVQNFSDLESIFISSASGTIDVGNLTDIGSLKINSTSGQINATTLSGGQASLSNMSGDIILENVNIADDFSVETVSGIVYFNNLVTSRAFFSTGSGDIHGSSISVNSLVTNSTSGDVNIDRTEATQITAETASGRIDYSVIGDEGDYFVTTSTVSGDVDVPQSANGAPKTADLSSISGDIYFEIAR